MANIDMDIICVAGSVEDAMQALADYEREKTLHFVSTKREKFGHDCKDSFLISEHSFSRHY